ncbi:hypothetical protein FRC04_004494 [Tulasnella sp. 424]|nr:hypothetical protein FRC04_004494 [Tulasnella sp. 424]KAG8976563.1 hypothetical protein FRC05_003402 [Tulasnella sp. 425]
MKRQYHPQQSSGEHFDDDPEKLMGLPPLEKISEFWKRYDRLADITDGKMTSDLSENLDVLLIFAALFSAINTAFISLTMPALSSDPFAETNTLLRLLITRADNNTLVPADLSPAFSPSSNSVIANCLLYASLSCSLLAAVGAMMGKEWLQSFDRTGQTGPLEEQGRFRQRKYDGVQRWHLESIIQSLPNLLLLSVMLFFAGVYLFLLAVNKVVAIVVIAFFGGGAVLCGVTIVMGSASPLCPYQSAASRALRRTGFLFTLQWWRRQLRTIRDLAVVVKQFISKVPDIMRRSSRISTNLELVESTTFPTTPREAGTPEEVMTAQAARWLLETTSNRGDQVAAAQFICTLNNTACSFAFEDSETWRRLVSLTCEAFDTWHSQPDARNQKIAELFGSASCHVLLQFSNDAVKGKDLTDLLPDQSESFGRIFLQALHFALARYPCRVPEDEEYILHVAFLSVILNRGPVIAQYQWHRLSQFFLVERTDNVADVLLGLWAIDVCDMGSGRGRASRSYAFSDLMRVGENK